MTSSSRYFAPFRLDADNEQLWRGDEEIRLRRKTFAVLRHLVGRPGELVTKAALLDAVWPNVSVSDSMPAISVRELRRALGDSADTPRFIETVQRRGYRFIAPVTMKSAEVPAPSTTSPRSSQLGTPLNAFVGRNSELTELRTELEDATSGHGRICLISGEPGIGKTRLCAEFAAEAQAKGVASLFGHCYEQEAVPYLPFIEVLESYIDRSQSADELRRMFADEGPELARLLPRVRRMLPDLPPALELSLEMGRRHLFDSVCNFIAGRCREQSTLLILEDLHWADDSTLELISHLSQRISDLPLVVIGTHRISEVEVRPNLSRTLEDLVRGRLAIQLRLEGLPLHEVALMLKGLGGHQAPQPVVREIYGETEGNPFFVEELFRHLSEEDQLFDREGKYRTELKIDEREVPQNVQLVVGRRFARLNDETAKLLGVAAVIGRSFGYELLEASNPIKGEALLDCFDKAERVGLIRSSTEYLEAQFEFVHELTRQVVLSQLSVGRRQRLHLEVAEAIERLYADTLEDRYGDLAYHYSQTSNLRKAIDYLRLAGLQAIQRYIPLEAVTKLSLAIKLLRNLPENPDRDRLELNLRFALAGPLIDTTGFTVPEVERNWQRAGELGHRVGSPLKVLQAQFGIAQVLTMTGNTKAALSALKRILYDTESAKDPALTAQTRDLLGMLTFYVGDFEAALSHFSRVVEQYDQRKGQNLATAVEAHSALHSISYEAWTLWYMGYPEQALRKIEQTLTLAETLSRAKTASPMWVAMALNHAARVHMHRRDVDRARELAEASIAISGERGLIWWLANSTMMQGYALALAGETVEGIGLLEKGLANMPDQGAKEEFSGWLADAYGTAGRYRDGLTVLAKVIRPDGEAKANETWLHRLRGELLLMLDPSNTVEAERCFRTAIAADAGYGAKGPQLRATTSLARLLRDTGRRAEARAMLAEIYSWFTEGLNTRDLVEAKVLLEEFNS